MKTCGLATCFLISYFEDEEFIFVEKKLVGYQGESNISPKVYYPGGQVIFLPPSKCICK